MLHYKVPSQERLNEIYNASALSDTRGRSPDLDSVEEWAKIFASLDIDLPIPSKQLSAKARKLLNSLKLSGTPAQRAFQISERLMQTNYGSSTEDLEELIKRHGSRGTRSYLNHGLKSIAKAVKSPSKSLQEKSALTGGSASEDSNPDYQVMSGRVKGMKRFYIDKDIFKKALKELQQAATYRFDKKSGVVEKARFSTEYQRTRGIPPDWTWVDEEILALDDDVLEKLIVDNELFYNQPIKKKSPKTFRAVLIDDSGSMCNTTKNSWVAALLLLFSENIDEDNQLVIGLFEYELSRVWTIKTPEAAEEFLAEFQGGNGGETNIERSLSTFQQVVREYRDQENLPDPEVYLINDGQDQVSPNFLPDFKTNCITLFEKNVDLWKGVKASGGSVHFVNQKGLRLWS